MITILHAIPTLGGGGAERQLCMLASEQARRGACVHVGIRRGGVHEPVLKKCGVHIHELGNARSINPRLLLALTRTITKVAPTIVQTWLPQMDVVGGLAAVRSRTPWIISERTSGEYYREVPTFARLRLLASRYAGAVVANSKGGEDYWTNDGPRSLRRTTIPNAIDFKGINESAATPAEKSHARPLLLVVGRFDRGKAHAIVVHALSILSEKQPVNVMMIGEGSEQGSIGKQIEAASLSNRIKLTAYQPDWWRWLKVADGLISMTRYEGNPNVALEAMAGGCPVILSDIPAHREIADSSSALFVPVEDAQSLSQAILTLVNGKDAALSRAQQALKRVSPMTLSSMADAYEAVYREVLNRKD
jgi:glycosyltransferase involved in cell wall biosynthesis